MPTNKRPEESTPEQIEAERYHDETIAPILRQVMDLCRERKMPFIFAVEFSPGRYCTSAGGVELGGPRMAPAAHLLLDGCPCKATLMTLAIVSEGAPHPTPEGEAN